MIFKSSVKHEQFGLTLEASEMKLLTSQVLIFFFHSSFKGSLELCVREETKENGIMKKKKEKHTKQSCCNSKAPFT